ncbi:hypothetical protein JCM6882_009728 [Rhodosporidiobolus microsporus]
MLDGSHELSAGDGVDLARLNKATGSPAICFRAPDLLAMPSVDSPAYPLYFIGHAGVGLLFSDAETAQTTRDNLREIGKEILALQPRPKAVVVFSGHFVADEIRGPGALEVNVKPQTPIWHDFVNDFHDSAPFVYEYEWPHLDAPELASEVYRELKAAGVDARRVQRGVDHGVWVPAKVLFPEETPLDIPVIQVSTYHGYDLEQQYKLGEVAARLESLGYLLLGSGMICHSFEYGKAPEAEKNAVGVRLLGESKRFDAAVKRAASLEGGEERRAALLGLEKLLEFKQNHPTVEHFTPLLVIAGAAGNAQVEVLGKEAISPGQSTTNFRFTPLPASA